MARLSKKTFNNILIVAILAFIALFNLPKVLQDQSIEPQKQADTKVIALLPEFVEPVAINIGAIILRKENGYWTSNIALTVLPQVLVERWLTLTGTYVDDTLVQQLQLHLKVPLQINIHQKQNSENFNLIYYQTKDFWLVRNWQQKWLAVSVDPTYLMPLH